MFRFCWHRGRLPQVEPQGREQTIEERKKQVELLRQAQSGPRVLGDIHRKKKILSQAQAQARDQASEDISKELILPRQAVDMMSNPGGTSVGENP